MMQSNSGSINAECGSKAGSASLRSELLALGRSRYGFVFLQGALLMAALLALRLGLLFQFCLVSDASPGAWLRALAVGAHLDLVVCLLLLLPALALLALLPQRWFAKRVFRTTFLAAAFVFWMGQIFSLASEYFFFEEFHSRYNTVAVDYVLYPHEVFVNIWESYPVAWVALGCALVAGAAVAVSRVVAWRIWEQSVSLKWRWGIFGATLAFALALLPTVSLAEARFSPDRTLNEVSSNGLISLAVAAWSHNLDYGAFYVTMDHAESYERTRRVIGQADAPFQNGPECLQRRIPGDSSKPRLNVVLLLEESLGSEFWGSLGRKEPTLTPQLDKLAQEGLLFTNLYADGNRTVRGFEGVLSSFPPLPGDSIVKRDRSENVETIARVLKRDGYDTMFLYGGRGLFDGMRSFAINNGYDRFVEQKDFPKPVFTTVWGVCNEDLYQRTIEECRSLDKTGKPFFATVLSVSNHKPFTYPKGRIWENPNERVRPHAVKYTDWALGHFFEAAKKEAFWKNTIFVVIADHGARVYGSQSIPIHSYEIPLLVLGPAAVKEPSRNGTLGCQLDVAPTILGMIGRSYESLFYGHDLLAAQPQPSRVVLNHNRDIGLLVGERMVVLGLNKTVEFYRGDPKSGNMTKPASPDDTDKELAKDAIALYQTADDLYMHRKYRIDK